MSSPGAIRIRAAEPADAVRLTEIAHAAKRHWGYDEELIELWSGDLTITPELVGDCHVYCAVTDSEIVGFYALSSDGDQFDLEHMWVDPPHIGAGIGRSLFAHAVDAVAGSRGTTLRVVSDPNAEGFYRSMGAVPAGKVPSEPEGRTLPVLRLKIAQPGAEGPK